MLLVRPRAVRKDRGPHPRRRRQLARPLSADVVLWLCFAGTPNAPRLRLLFWTCCSSTNSRKFSVCDASEIPFGNAQALLVRSFDIRAINKAAHIRYEHSLTLQIQ